MGLVGTLLDLVLVASWAMNAARWEARPEGLGPSISWLSGAALIEKVRILWFTHSRFLVGGG